MKRILIFLFDKWWRPILFWLVAVVLVVTNGIIGGHTFGNVSLMLLGIALLGLIASSIFQLFKRRWIKGILTGFLFGGTIIAFILYGILYGFLLFFIETVDGDKWADNLTIPTNIQLHNPIDLTTDYRRPDSMLSVTNTNTNLQLYNSFQPGLYEYDFWIGKIESGIIYLKAYEITQGYALSTDRLPERSSVRVYNPTDSVMRFSTTSDFTIYEGDWGKPYAARFEVWFKPYKNGQERKLFQKNYKIEGWQR
jgi:hypothetical protein